MAATTPSEAVLFERYDRLGRRGEEQIGSGMLLSILEVRDRRYETETEEPRVGDFVTRGVFQNER